MTENTNEQVITKLIGEAHDRSSWETRLNAIKELEKYDTPKTRAVILSLAQHDLVFAVKEEAVRIANRQNYTVDGQKIGSA